MKCPNCGGEIKPGSSFCDSCGSQISLAMKKEQEQMNKTGCPRCGSSNVKYNREKNGELKGKNGTAIVRSTIGVCKDCGYTWQPNEPHNEKKSRKTWLWVLGWIFIFPLPLTIILLKKKDLKPALKYGIIAAAWILYLLIAIFGGSSSNTPDSEKPDTQNTEGIIYSEVTTNSVNTTSTVAESTIATDATTSIELIAGEPGKYGKEITMSAGTEFEENLIVYYLPAGKYTVKNLGQYRTQVSVYKGIVKNNETGYDEYTEVGDVIVLAETGNEDEIEIPDGWFIEIHEPDHISLTPLS